MPEFFVPAAKDRAQAEEVWNAVAATARAQGFEVTDRRVYAIGYTRDGRPGSDVVGEVERNAGEVVMVILETPSMFLTCTHSRGVARGGALLMSRGPTTTVNYFNPE